MKHFAKYILGILLINFLASCNMGTGNKEQPQKVENTKAENDDFNSFLRLFPKLDIPFEINIDNFMKYAESDLIPIQTGLVFLGSKIQDEEIGMPDFENRVVGKFNIDENKLGLIHRGLELPVGSGDNISFILNVFNKKGELLSRENIAEFSSWDGGYEEKNCRISENFRIESDYVFEDKNEALKIYKKEEKKYSYEINQMGKIDIDVHLVSSEKYSLAKSPFAIKELNKNTFPDIIKKDVSGKFLKGFSWKDNLGKNYLIFSKKEMKARKSENEDAIDYSFFAYHYVDIGEKYPKRIWKTQDYEKDCMFDSMLDLIDKSVTITDLDNDKIAETTYIYTLGCVSDVSPYPMKLIMHEGEDKMAIRGEVKLSMSGDDSIFDKDKLNYEIDEKSFEGKDRNFRNFAIGQWSLHEVIGR